MNLDAIMKACKERGGRGGSIDIVGVSWSCVSALPVGFK